MSMEKRALQLASVASMIDQFNIPNIKILQTLGYKVDVAADFTDPGTITAERAENLKKRLAEMEVRVFDIPIPRSVDPAAICTAYKKVKMLLDREDYSLLHCHSPIGGVIARQAAKSKRKDGLKVVYTAHGFHFYDGAPLKNWMIFYPIEKHFSKYTDILITINKEDYKRASRKFKAKKTVYVPGVGVDTEKFKPDENGREKIRKELGLNADRIMLLSVGEFNKNKNHETVIRSLAQMKECGELPDNLYYIIAGIGDRKERLTKLAIDSRLQERIKLVGFQSDIADYYDAADVFVFPSFREGLSVSLMEAMASGLSIVCSRIRGNTDLIDEGKGGFFFDPEDVSSVTDAIKKLLRSDKDSMGSYNLEKIKKFDIATVEETMKREYGGVTDI